MSWLYLKSDRPHWERFAAKCPPVITAEDIVRYLLIRDAIPRDDEHILALKEMVGAVLEIVQRPAGLKDRDEFFTLVIPEIHKSIRRMVIARKSDAEATSAAAAAAAAANE